MAGTLSFRRYAFGAAGVACLVTALLWAWVVAAPLAYLDREYGAFLAKRQMLAGCDIGRVLILGDSRAAADVAADRLPVAAANLAIGGGGPVEGFYLLRRALACPHPPEAVLLSFNAQHLSHADTFWERSVRFGLIDAADAADAAARAEAIGDAALDAHVGDGLSGPIRARMYAMRFPGFYAASVVRGGIGLRLGENRRALAEALRGRGHYPFGQGNGSSAVAMEGWMEAFTPRPVLDHYLRALLALAGEAGVPVRFIAMPVNDATYGAARPAVGASLAAYLAQLAAAYPGFSVAPDILPHWPDRLFGDGYAHLNAAGAAVATEAIASCLGTASGPGGTAAALRSCTLGNAPG